MNNEHYAMRDVDKRVYGVRLWELSACCVQFKKRQHSEL